MLITRGFGKPFMEEDTYILWDGSGIDDISTSWKHFGCGSEKLYAAYKGTYGLEMNTSSNQTLMFKKEQGTLNISIYKTLFLWVFLKKSFMLNTMLLQYSNTYNNLTTNTIDLFNYVDQSILNTWQYVTIDLDTINWSEFYIKDINTVSIFLVQEHFFYMDYIGFSICDDKHLVYIPITPPTIQSHYCKDSTCSITCY